eukprot:scaffold8514_cov55-Phaeocystis_antarctica.AAC.2
MLAASPAVCREEEFRVESGSSELLPKRPAPPTQAASLNPYHKFCREQRLLLPTALCDAEREKLLGKQWRALPEAERLEYKSQTSQANVGNSRDGAGAYDGGGGDRGAGRRPLCGGPLAAAPATAPVRRTMAAPAEARRFASRRCERAGNRKGSGAAAGGHR